VNEYENWATSPSAITRDETLSFDSQTLRDALEEWTLQAAGSIPARSQFTPRSVKSFAGNMTIVERRGDTYYIRLMGTRIASVIGEMQGKTIVEALPQEIARSWVREFDAVIAARAPQRIVKTVSFTELQYLEAEIFLAPLLDDQGELTMVFSVATFRSGVAPSHKLGDIITSNTSGNGPRNG
jgi:hypothetical protein